VQRTLQVLLRVSHDERYVSHGLWAESMQLLDSIGRQGGGWLKKSHTRKAPAA
jgi:glutamine cyclotransferase